MTASTLQILHSYRHLYRHALYAVRYAVPERYVIRDELRRAYRSGSVADFNREKIVETVAFLQSATEEAGTAHKIVRNITHMWWWQERARPNKRG